jgi:hypothetical protein
MKLFKEYGTEAIKRINKILELEKPIMIDFSDVDADYYDYGDEFYNWFNWTIDCIRETAEQNHVHVFIEGEGELRFQVSRFNVDPTKRDWSLKDELFGYNLVGGFSELINLDSDFGDKEFDNFICLCYRLKEDESIDDWDENDEVWDYIIQTFSEGIPSMKEELDKTIEKMDSAVRLIERTNNKLYEHCESYLDE